MLSPEIKFLIKWGVYIAHCLGGSPYTIVICNSKTNGINVEYCPKRSFWVHQLYQVTYFIYLVIAAVIHPNRNDPTFRVIEVTILMQAIFCILSLNILVVFTYLASGGFLANQYLNWLDYFERKYVKPGTKLRDGSEILMLLVMVVCMGFPFLYMGSVNAVYSQSPTLFFNVFPKESLALRFWLRVPITLFQLWMLLCGWSVIMYYVVFALTAGSIYKLIREMCPNQNLYLTNDNFRNPRNLQNTYRCMQIIFVYLEIMFGYIIPPIQFCLNKCFLVCNFNLMNRINGSVVGSGSGHSSSVLIVSILMSGSIISITVWVICLYLAGQMSRRSKICLRQMKLIEEENRQERKIMSKFLKSCLPLRVWFGKYYVIKHITFIKYFMGSIRGTGKVLLAFNKRK